MCSDLNIDKIFILWRENILERAISLKIAFATDKWYHGKDEPIENGDKTKKLNIKVNELKTLIKQQKRQWRNTFKDWPLGISPTFITYEELFPDYCDVIENKIYSCLGVAYQGWEEPHSLKQSNLTPYEEKVIKDLII